MTTTSFLTLYIAHFKEEETEEIENNIEEKKNGVELPNTALNAASKGPSMGTGVIMTATVANLKFKSKKSTAKSKSSRASSLKGPTKPSRRRSFLDENIKKAGKVESRRKSSTKINDQEKGNENIEKELEQNITLIEKDKRSSYPSVLELKPARNDSLKLLYEKEKNDLQQAYATLLDEYHRRQKVRQKIMAKFGRASRTLRMILSQKSQQENVGDVESRSQEIRDVFVSKRTNTLENEEKKRRFQYKRLEDTDRI